MDMRLPSDLGSFMANRGLLSNVEGVRRRQLSRLNAYAAGDRFNAKENRARRKAELKQKIYYNSLPRETSDALKANPRQHGLPRRFKVLIAGHDTTADCKVHDNERYTDENHVIHFAAFGIPGRPIQFNGTWVTPDGHELSPDGRIYTISFPECDGTQIHMYLDFTVLEAPTGYLEHSAGHYALQLQPFAVSFNVNVSNNAGAYWSTATQTLVWDETSTKWQNAAWDSKTMVFSYDTVTLHGPFGDTYLTEVSYQDSDDPTNVFTLDQSVMTQYVAAMNGMVGSGQDAYLQVTVTGAPAPPVSQLRAQDADGITSVYPVLSLWKFDELGVNFTGAYITSNNPNPAVFAVAGSAQSPFASPGIQLPPKDVGTAEAEPRPVFKSAVKPTPHFGTMVGDAPTPMSVSGLLNLDPMKPDPQNPSGFTDTVSVTANADFYNIITYWMDPSIRSLFISPNPTVLDPDVQAIATDDPTNNQAFYQSLTVPYITQSLGNTPGFELGKQCNALRASAQMKDIPTNSSVYAGQSDKLYKLRYIQQFNSITTYLNDQANSDYSLNIATGASAMKSHITQMSQDVNGSDPSVLAAALADIDSLAAWATSQKLFYAFYLYYWASTYYLASLSAQSGNGTLSSTVSRTLKKLTTVFGILENSQQNPNGKSFTEAFNDMIRVFQMTSLIPQFVDCDNDVSDFDSIVQEMLQQFYIDNNTNSNPNIAREAALAIQLANDQAILQGFTNNLAISMRMTGSLGNWAETVNNFASVNGTSNWYTKLANASDMAATFMRASCVALLILPMIASSDGGWKAMTTEQKTEWSVTASALLVTFTIKALQSTLRVLYYWTDLGGFGVNVFKAFFGSAKVLADVANASEATTNTFAQWLIRTGPESMKLAGDDVTVAMKIFGRSAGEFLANCVGAVLAGVNIVMSIIDAVKTNDPLEKAMDSMMIISSGFQLLAIGASWLISAEIVTTEATIALLQTIGACLGPLAIVFAIAGLVIMIVMMFRKGPPPDNPVQDFIDNQVNNAGLKMTFDTAIDYFNVVPADAAAGSLNGISFEVSGSNGNQYMQLGAPNGATPPVYPVQFAPNITYLPDTCWCVKTDSSGNTMVFTYALDSENNKVSLCLGEQSDGSVAIVPLPQQVTKDANGNPVLTPPDVYKQEMSMLQWYFTTLSSAAQVTRTVGTQSITYATQANFSLSRNNKSLYVVEQSNGSYALQLSASEPSQSFTQMTLTLQSMGPSAFSYVQNPWTLTLNNTDEEDFVNFYGTTSLPLQWTISPALPTFLTMGDPATNPGSIIQVPATTPTLMDATQYTVTASISILGTVYSRQANVTISVVDGTKPPPSPTLQATRVSDSDAFSSAMADSGIQSLRSRTTASNNQTNGTAAQVVGATSGSERRQAPVAQIQTLSSTGVDPELQTRYDNMMGSAPAFFKWLPSGTVNLNAHYTAGGAIQTLQNSVTGTWTPQSLVSQNYEDIYFANRPPVPYTVPYDPINYNQAANAFVVQAIFNGDGHAQQTTNISGTQGPVNIFNQYLWTNNLNMFNSWLQSSGSNSTTGGPCSYDDYYSAITNRDWVAMKAALQTNPGGWSNQSFEMFHHFLKLDSIGASYDQIQAIFTTLTVQSGDEPVLDPSGFNDITPSTWQKYTGYIYNIGINSSQLNVQNLNQSREVGIAAGGSVVTVTRYADTAFVAQAGFYQSPPSGCCFDGNTSVVLADGSEISISKVEPGQFVRSGMSGTTEGSVVRWVSRPMQKGRSLYAYKSLPGVLFTGTHPIYLGEEDGASVLGFVDVDTAERVNFLWGSCHLRELAKEDLIEYQAGTIDRELFDLVLEDPPSDGSHVTVPTFMVKNAAGQHLTVCSEAPNLSALPATTRFMLGFANALGRQEDIKSFFPDGLRMGVLDYDARIKRHRSACAAEAIRGNANARAQAVGSKPVNMDTVLSIFSQAKINPQILADSVEAMTATLGLTLPARLQTGWQHYSSSSTTTESSPSTSEIDIISTHFLQLAHPGRQTIPSTNASSHRDLVSTLSRRLRKSPSTTASISTPTSTPTVNSTEQTHPTKHHALGVNLHTLQSTLRLPVPPTPAQAYTLTMTIDSDVSLIATGTLTDNVVATWPVYYSPHNTASVKNPALSSFNVGWILVSYGLVTAAQVDDASRWDEPQEGGLSAMDRYAELLGNAVGEDVVNTVYGNGGKGTLRERSGRKT